MSSEAARPLLALRPTPPFFEQVIDLRRQLCEVVLDGYSSDFQIDT
jgi:hypothetical protein